MDLVRIGLGGLLMMASLSSAAAAERNKPAIVAHRGASGTLPEHTLPHLDGLPAGLPVRPRTEPKLPHLDRFLAGLPVEQEDVAVGADGRRRLAPLGHLPAGARQGGGEQAGRRRAVR